MHETALDEETTSTETVIDWYNYCWEVYADKIMKQHVRPIGGPGTTVEIDESKFGNMKYDHKGHLKDSGSLVAFAARPRPASLFH